MSETQKIFCFELRSNIYKENNSSTIKNLNNFVRQSVLAFILLHHIVSRKVVLATIGGIFSFPASVAYCHRERKRTPF